MGRLGSRLPPVNVPDWKLIDFHEDSDTGTALDFDTGTIPVHDLYKVVVSYYNQSTASGSGLVRVNGNSTANYNWVQFDGDGTLGQNTGITEWHNVGRPAGNQAALVVFILKGRTITGGFFPVIRNMTAQEYGQQELIRGELADNVAEVNRIRWWSANEATGKVAVYGRDLPT